MATTTTRRTLWRIGVLGATALGCATASQDVRRDGAPAAHTPSPLAVDDRSLASQPRRTSDILTAAELSGAPGLANATAYDAVMRLRPSFLTPRSLRPGSVGRASVRPAVLVEGAYHGGPEVLHVIAASAVVEMQYVHQVDAMHRYGPGYEAGVILVRLRR